MRRLHPTSRICGLYPTWRGFGFVVLERRGRLRAWGVAHYHSTNNTEFLAGVEAFLEKHRPTLVALEDASLTKRGEVAKARIEAVVGYLHLRDIATQLVSTGEQKAALELSRDATKHQIATALTLLFPELLQHLPRKRKPWQSEDERMSLFAAAGMALVVAGAAEDKQHAA
jgi:hypothetical protein